MTNEDALQAYCVGRVFAWFRKYNKLTQREAAVRMGLGQSSLAHIETGRQFPRLVKLLALERTFDPSVGRPGCVMEVAARVLACAERGFSAFPGHSRPYAPPFGNEVPLEWIVMRECTSWVTSLGVAPRGV